MFLWFIGGKDNKISLWVILFNDKSYINQCFRLLSWFGRICSWIKVCTHFRTWVSHCDGNWNAIWCQPCCRNEMFFLWSIKLPLEGAHNDDILSKGTAQYLKLINIQVKAIRNLFSLMLSLVSLMCQTTILYICHYGMMRHSIWGHSAIGKWYLRFCMELSALSNLYILIIFWIFHWGNTFWWDSPSSLQTVH